YQVSCVLDIRYETVFGLDIRYKIVFGSDIQSVLTPNCIPAAPPLATCLKLSTDAGEVLTEPDVFKRMIGRLLYLRLRTRLDLSYATQHLSKFMHCPRVPHLKAALHVLKFLKGTCRH
ncbi:Retrovirus-related Pol polyprotein from transposon RE1, partial [Bienertia sinuspersici]